MARSNDRSLGWIKRNQFKTGIYFVVLVFFICCLPTTYVHYYVGNESPNEREFIGKCLFLISILWGFFLFFFLYINLKEIFAAGKVGKWGYFISIPCFAMAAFSYINNDLKVMFKFIGIGIAALIATYFRHDLLKNFKTEELIKKEKLRAEASIGQSNLYQSSIKKGDFTNLFGGNREVNYKVHTNELSPEEKKVNKITSRLWIVTIILIITAALVFAGVATIGTQKDNNIGALIMLFIASLNIIVTFTFVDILPKGAIAHE